MEENKEAIEKVKWLTKAAREEFFKLAKLIPLQCKVEQKIVASYFVDGYAHGFSQGEDSARKQIAKTMFLNPEYNSIGQIMDDTGVTFEYIESLAKEEEIKKEGKI